MRLKCKQWSPLLFSLRWNVFEVERENNGEEKRVEGSLRSVHAILYIV
jgi:hypothetical protein